ncbi:MULTISPECIES: trans-aconitate 2-methyltransferase [unclassified Streptomyces]|uniref:class I SAM-dependent methyltransferase n=1 Tax=unclassified Streptomyces TaxID=2593676 RepID=UPI00278C3DB6|nr:MULTISPECIES: class I SAM-dependent methyltransferase [unclassified Streptomyces]
MATAPPKDAGTAYSAEHAAIYDLIHAARGRNWAAEADDLAALVRERNPGARSLLDVACGTGAHLAALAPHFEETAGLELSSAMREIARRSAPDTVIHPGDMRDFDLGRTYDAVLCMCFSLGYMTSQAELDAAAGALVRHLAPGGVVVAEPWWFPEKFLDGFVSAALAEEPGRAVSRLSHSVRDGGLSRMTVRYTVADGDGIHEFTEYETYSLFPHDAYTTAFRRAGAAVEFLEGGPNGRGLFVGRRG